ncbi:MAG: ABC transporter permease, partial [Deltaproteobacteria bacterium]|nr:ABC transporter permease [Deltaproteobacteria bacterium]
MVYYIAKRLLMMAPVLLGISLIIFTVMSFSPGSPGRLILGERADESAVRQLNEQLGFYDPFIVKYFRYVGRAVQGDLGVSFKTKLPVIGEIMARFPTTAKLAILAMFISSILSIPLGVICAVRQYSFFDSTIMVLALIFVAMPAFWLGLLLILTFSLHLGLFPVSGADSWRHFILPALTLALINVAVDL